MIKVVLLGTGNVATHLFEAFQKANNVSIVQVYNRTQKGLLPFVKHTATTTEFKKIIEANVYIIAIADDAIADLSKRLPFQNKLVVHTSGSIAMESLSNQNRKGVFYPLQTFTKGKEMDFSPIPICLEANDDKDMIILTHLAESIGENIHQISSKQRKALHVAAVFVNNFVNHLYALGEQICDDNEVSFDLLKPLIQETAQKIIALSPTDSQTGPAKRNDQKVIANHIADLNNKNQQEIYTLLTQSITAKYGNKL